MLDEYHAEINVIVKALLDSFMVLGIIGFCSWIYEEEWVCEKEKKVCFKSV